MAPKGRKGVSGALSRKKAYLFVLVFDANKCCVCRFLTSIPTFELACNNMDFLLQVFLFLLCFDDRFSFPVLLNGLSDKRSKEDHLICQKLSKSFTHDFCRRGISTFQMRDNPEVKTLQPCPEKQQGRRLWKLITIHINKLNKLIWKNLLKIVSLFDFWTSLSWSLPSSFIPCIIRQSQPDVNDQRSSAFSDPSPFLADKMCQLEA